MFEDIPWNVKVHFPESWATFSGMFDDILRKFPGIYLESGFLSVAYLTVANLARLGISVDC